MALILALEPDARQAAVVTDVITRHLNAEARITVSKDAALAALAERLPDILLVTTLLSPRDENEITDSLRALDQAGVVPMLSIPLLIEARAEQEPKPTLLKAVKRRRKTSVTAGCEPAVFAGQIRSYLECARELKEEWQARQEGERREAGGERESQAAAAQVEDAAIAIERALPEPVFESRSGSDAEFAGLETNSASDPNFVEALQLIEVEAAIEPEPAPAVEAIQPIEAELFASAVPEQVVAHAPLQLAAPRPLMLLSAGTELISAALTRQLSKLTLGPATASAMWRKVLASPRMMQPVATVSTHDGRRTTDDGETALWQPLFNSPDPTPVLESFVSVDPFVISRLRAMSEADNSVAAETKSLVQENPLIEVAALPDTLERRPTDGGQRTATPESIKRKRRRTATKRRKPTPPEADVYELPASIDAMGRSDEHDGLTIDVRTGPAAVPQPVLVPSAAKPTTLEPATGSEYEGQSPWLVPIEAPATTPNSADAEWMARELEALHARVEHLQAAREAQAEALGQSSPRSRPSMDSGRPERVVLRQAQDDPEPGRWVEGRHAAGPRPGATPKPELARRRRAKPIQDEWGVYDPDRCGFSALFARLDALNGRPSTSAIGREPIDARSGDTRRHPLDNEPVVQERQPSTGDRVPQTALTSRARRPALDAARSAAKPTTPESAKGSGQQGQSPWLVPTGPSLAPLAAWARTFRPSIVERSASIDRFGKLRARGEQGRTNDQDATVDDCSKLLAGLNVPDRVAGVRFPRGCRIRRVRVQAPAPRPTSPQDGLVVILSRKLLAQCRQQSRVWYHAPVGQPACGAHEQIA